MKTLLSRGRGANLEDRLEALRVVVETGRDRLDPADVDSARTLLDRAAERIGIGAEHTVVALAGATGSGKSSLFNALSGSDLSQVGVLRPTTGTAHATVWGEGDPGRLLDWLGVPRRHHQRSAELDGLVLLDLPDHDSTQVEHRLEVDRLAQLVDVFVWVLDPQKYADAAIHDGYLRPLATHAAVTLVVLNQIDRLTESERRRCVGDATRLIEADGLRDVRVLSTSARTGEGVAELREAIVARVREERAALERLSADLDGLVVRLSRYCGPRATPLAGSHRDGLTRALAAAAGVEVVTDAVARAHRRDAALTMGWPFTRWLRRFRPDPLGRLHLRRDSGGGRTSLPAATPLQRAQAESAVRAVAAEASSGLPQPWPELVRERAAGSIDALLEDLDRAISAADLGDERRPAWWSAVGALQVLLTTVALIGFAWLTMLFVLEWFQIPRPPTPEVEEVPWPTLLLFGGLLAGFLVSVIFGQFARVGAARRRRRADKQLRQEVGRVARARVIDPVELELAAYSSLCDALGRMRR
ncbi:MAG: 50S ribosome-binding GTPase [Actinomycetota bacterium]|nr:50S ribosome-binding GTPase [Actinomycetota bacterium]